MQINKGVGFIPLQSSNGIQHSHMNKDARVSNSVDFVIHEKR